MPIKKKTIMLGYYKDKENIYFNNEIIKNVDLNSFVILNNPFNKNDTLQNHFAKDTYSVFLNRKNY